METKIKLNNKKIVIVFIILLISITTYLKAPKQDLYNFTNSDATWHTLLTIKALQDTPISVHKLLPIVSLGEFEDKGIPWGGTVESNGNFYYTSFMPLSYIIPYIIFSVFNLPINELSLFALSTTIAIFCYILLTRLFIKIYKEYIKEEFIILATALLYFFTTEMIHCTGAVYWGQSLWQLVFLLQINVFYEMRQSYTKKKFIIFALLSLLAPSVEWTGYISNFGFMLIFLIDKNGISKNKEYFLIPKKTAKQFIATLIATLTAIVAFIIHFSSVIPFNSLMYALFNRFSARNTSNVIYFKYLLIGYINSYKSILILLLVLLVLVVINKSSRKKFVLMTKSNYIIIFLLTIPLFENIIMLEHASSYTYDRMKAILLLIFFFIAFSIALLEYRNSIKILISRLVLTSLIVTSCFNFYIYCFTDNKYRWKDAELKTNEIFTDYIKSNYNRSNSVLSQNILVRAYDNLIYSRGIFESVTESVSKAKAIELNKNYYVHLIPIFKHWNKNVHNKAIIGKMNSDSRQMIYLDTVDNKIKTMDDILTASDLTDANWKEGVSRENMVLLFENNDFNLSKLQGGIQLKSNGITVNIINIEVLDGYIQVTINDAAGNFSYPNLIEVIK